MSRASCVALLSDFGTRDTYVGVMKAVVARSASAARIIDLTHEIPPGDIRQGAFRLWQALPFLPPGTVLLAVVDPGVGTSRRPVAIQAEGFFFVGPDNGIFTYVLGDRRALHAVEISVPGVHPPSATFHGRDVFAPAAGLLASGVRIDRLGPEAAGLSAIPWPRLSAGPEGHPVRGEILLADRFGNLVTSIGRLAPDGGSLDLQPWVPDCPSVRLPARGLEVRLPDGSAVKIGRTFAEAAPGESLAYIGSDGLLEVAVNRGSAADSLGLSAGMDISLART